MKRAIEGSEGLLGHWGHCREGLRIRSPVDFLDVVRNQL